jgi:hypothetical protein
MKPLPEKLLQSLSGELEFLGPYPFYKYLINFVYSNFSIYSRGIYEDNFLF